MFKNAIVNNWANAAIIVNTASLVGGLASGFNLGGTTAPQTNAGSNMVVIG